MCTPGYRDWCRDMGIQECDDVGMQKYGDIYKLGYRKKRDMGYTGGHNNTQGDTTIQGYGGNMHEDVRQYTAWYIYIWRKI